MASVFVVKGKLENPMEWYSTIEDLSEQEFFGWETSDWIALADSKELVYGSYHEDDSAEFVHIKEGVCLKDYRMYEFELDTEEGDTPAFEDWADVCEYVETHLLSM